MSKSQGGFYAYNPGQVIMSTPGGYVKQNSSQSGHSANNNPCQHRYQNYTGQENPTSQLNYRPYNSGNSKIGASNSGNIYGSVHSGYANQGYATSVNYQSHTKENKVHY